MTLKEKVINLPDLPGVYLMKDDRGHIIYVGKAISLRNRVRSYFQKGEKDGKTAALLRTVRDLDTIVTHNELEALILESTLIKRHHPRFNIILRDDKNYPYLRFDIKSKYPRLDVVRGLKNDGALYYGPYVPAGGMWEILAFIRRTFPLATCSLDFDNKKNAERPCVQHQIGRCLAPCSGNTDQDAYREIVNQARLFIEGKNRDLMALLKERMQEAADNLEYERAAELRDRITKIKGAFQKQKIISPDFEDQDVLGIAINEEQAEIQVLFIRKGILIGKKNFHLLDIRGMSCEVIMSNFMNQFYSKEMLFPDEVLLPCIPQDHKVIQEWLSTNRGISITITTPQRGRKKELVQMASDNAMQTLKEHTLSQRSKERVLIELQKSLGLRNLPRRIEAFDISNIQGTSAVASMVTFENNLPNKRLYKRYKIRTVRGQDDFASMAEVIKRRYTRAKIEGTMPDLILIDGGKGQLNAARNVLQELQASIPDIIGLAKARSGEEGTEKEFERVIVPGLEEPIVLDPSSSITHLIARVRDEAHRFAINYHRKLRSKLSMTSELDAILGIGHIRKKALLRQFGSLARIKQASVNELVAVKGISKPLAHAIKIHFDKRANPESQRKQ